MVWVTVVVAIAVLGAAAWAGTGRLGEMPEPVDDRPKGHVPEGPVDERFLEEMALPVVGTGYDRGQVDARLASHVAGEVADPDARFDVVRRGYDMQAVDTILDRLLAPPVGGPAHDRDSAESGPAYVSDEPETTVAEHDGEPADPIPPEVDHTHAEVSLQATRGDPPAG